MTNLAKSGKNHSDIFWRYYIFCSYLTTIISHVLKCIRPLPTLAASATRPSKALITTIKGGHERKGECYQHLLSKKTLQYGKAKKAPCPKCGNMFLWFETHLRTMHHVNL